MPPKNQICDLFSLIERVYGGDNGFDCVVYAVKKGVSDDCDQGIASHEIEIVKARLQDIYDALKNDTHSLSGTVTKDLYKIGTLCLCKQKHAKVIYETRAQDQWIEDLGDPQRFLNDMNRYLAPDGKAQDEEARDRVAGDKDAHDMEYEVSQGSLSPTHNSTLSKDRLSPEDVNRIVALRLNEKLGTLDQKPGWLYALSHPIAQDRIKVGYTTDRSRRFGYHERCYPGFREISSIFIPHVHRFEQIIHAEYGQEKNRLEKPCDSCGITHREWLRVDEPTLKASMKAWEKFAKSQPYDDRGNLHKCLTPPAAGFSRARNRWQKWAKDQSIIRSSSSSSPKSTPTREAPPRAKKSRSSTSPSPFIDPSNTKELPTALPPKGITEQRPLVFRPAKGNFDSVS
ncbi:hypothetical protein N7510_005408 [Penicillium lagena]|uniref:uncharacterized protein n=1 Tax=Penicillium lagena TaxID=94218 RepID=UPI00253FDB46|nr:uncharacterized protein N7510_005408 [Penicillium lagena]KAJ5612214.1 hypothetical protein N7510_005408 [Penicillium lagena]